MLLFFFKMLLFADEVVLKYRFFVAILLQYASFLLQDVAFLRRNLALKYRFFVAITYLQHVSLQ